jgi:hypothetical protein
MSYLSIDIRCDKCDLVAATLVERSEKDSSWECPDCDGTMARTLSAPNITRRSYVDGTKRKGFAEHKEIAKLEVEEAELPASKRGEIRRTIETIKRLK